METKLYMLEFLSYQQTSKNNPNLGHSKMLLGVFLFTADLDIYQARAVGSNPMVSPLLHREMRTFGAP